MFYAEIYQKWLGATQREKIRQILKKLSPKGKILDLGSGFGVLEHFVDAVAVDINENYLRKTEAKRRVKASGDALPFKNETFDLVFCIDTVHLLKNHGEIERVLKRGGRLVISVFCYRQNFEERADWLRRIVKAMELKAEQEFLVKTETEWDFVIVARKD